MRANADGGGTVRVGAIGDLHCGRIDPGLLRSALAAASAQSDVLVLCGDLIDRGLPEEARMLARELAASVTVPTIAVLGNHDVEGEKEEEIVGILREIGVHVLDGDSCEIHGLGIAGVKGFGGGFGVHTLGAWGERAIKTFVHEAINEALKLETALSQLRVAQRIAVLHYAPIVETLAGESPEIFAFLGSSRLEEPLNRYQVAAVFHGHAHGGCAEGHTSTGIPVYNVALPVLERTFPDRPPVRILEFAVTPSADTTIASAGGAEHEAPSPAPQPTESR
jgi:Icc-related predicted phosphoesterase